MSYSLAIPCHNCKKQKPLYSMDGVVVGECEDGKELQETVNKIHSKPFGESHQGTGTIVLMCSRVDPKS